MTDFDPWYVPDLLRFLRSIGALSKPGHAATAAEVQEALGIALEAAVSAKRRLEELGLVEVIPGAPQRYAGGADRAPIRLTPTGTRAVLANRIDL